MSRFPLVITLGLLMIGTAAQALTSAGPNRPAGVPADFVITPFGYFHPSCVGHLAKGDQLRGDLKIIQHANGTSDPIQVCAYPHFKADGTKIVGQERAVKGGDPTIGHAWVEWASVTTTTAYSTQAVWWNVPAAPTNSDGQTLYYFPGYEDYSDVVTIIQPVLGWNSDYSNAWGIAAWNCCENGSTWEGTPAPVNSGDQIEGLMFNLCGSGVLTCSSWDIYIFDLTNGGYSVLGGTSNFGQTFNWAFGGVMEVYNIARCGDYPSDGSISFYDQELYDYNGVRIKNPAWTISKASGLTPGCHYGGSMPKQINLNY